MKVYTIGTTEEGREMLAVAIASDALMAKLDANKADIAKLADPRTIAMNDAEASREALDGGSLAPRLGPQAVIDRDGDELRPAPPALAPARRA